MHGDIQIQAISAAPNQLEGAALLPWLTRWSRTSGGATRWGRRNSSCPVGETAGTLARELHRVSAGLGAARRRGSQGQEGGGDEEAGQVRLEGPLPPVDGKGGPRPRRATVRVFSAKSRDPIFTFNP